MMVRGPEAAHATPDRSRFIEQDKEDVKRIRSYLSQPSQAKNQGLRKSKHRLCLNRNFLAAFSIFSGRFPAVKICP